MYHYLYGSIEDSGSPSTPSANETDSLVGEALIATDNEEEDTPKNSDPDFQHLLMSSGDGGIHNIEENKRKAQAWYKHVALQLPLAFSGVLIFLVAMFCATLLFPNSWLTSVINSPRETWTFRMLFPKVERGTYGDPVDGFIDTSLFHPSLISTDNSRIFRFPFPTGAFWTNLVLHATADRGLSYPIVVYPYAYKWSGNMLQTSYPARHRREEAKAIHDDFMPDLSFDTVEGVAKREIIRFDPLSVHLRYTNNNGHWETYLVQGSPYITLKYSNASPRIKAFSVFSDLFCPREDGASISQSNLHRKLRFGVCYSLHSNETDTYGAYRGVQFILQTQEGMNWMVFASEPITLTYDKHHRTMIKTTAPFKGVLRLAYIPPSSFKSTNGTIDVFSSTGLQRLIYHAGVYPTGGDVSWSFRAANPDSTLNLANKAVRAASGVMGDVTGSMNTAVQTHSTRVGTIQFNFETATFAPASSASTPKELLMLALPHHAQSIPTGAQLSTNMFDLSYKCIKGPLRPVLGSSWSYDEDLPSLGFDGDSGSNQNYTHLDAGVRKVLLDNLEVDIKLAPPLLTENVYGFGKQIARLAQLVHIADILRSSVKSTHGSTSSDPSDQASESSRLDQVFNEAIESLSSKLQSFLTNDVSDYLVFDSNLGGLVTIDGLRDSHADFGNGRYNDHLFHYGYILYACSVLGSLRPAFVHDFGAYVDAIYFDVAYDSNPGSSVAEGAFFPFSRHKVWFDGHSFASGLFPFGNGKSQESSSEAVNCYYGAYLWSLTRHKAAKSSSTDASAATDFARLLLAMEIRGARTYWHMSPSNVTNGTESLSVYSSAFAHNYIVGNVGMLDAVCSTWFGTEQVYVHMINFLPITSVTGELFPREFASKEYDYVLKPLGDVQMAWRGYVIGDHAIADPQDAWKQAQEVNSAQLDAGLSKTQLLFWISTRKDFAMTATNSDPAPASSPPDGEQSSVQVPSDSSCLRHHRCVGMDLEGDCCPTSQGTVLDCCSR